MMTKHKIGMVTKNTPCLRISDEIVKMKFYYYVSIAVADLHGKILDERPPGGPNSFNFMQFLGKFGKIVCWRPPWGVGAPSSGKS